jgi:hypothetical protein
MSHLAPTSKFSVVLKDANGKAYSNDFVDINILFGMGGFPAAYPLGPTPIYVTAFGTGPGLPGLIYPEIYLPANHELLIDVQRSV